MPVPQYVLDGTMQYGSQSVTINGTAYIFDNFTVTRPKTDADDQDSLGAPQRRRVTHGRSTFSAELQLATSATVRPVFGNTFALNVDAAYGSETWVLDPVNFEMDNGPGNIRVAQVTGWKAVGAITTSGTNVG